MRKAIALAAATLASITIAPAAMAQCAANGWCRVDDNYERTLYMRHISRNGRYVTADVQRIYKPWARKENYVLRAVYDCQAARFMFIEERPQLWADILPGTVGENQLRFACR